MEILDEDDNLSDPNWSKMASKATTSGYREGISLARDSLFQQGFDIGFETGFKVGFSLGMLHGSNRSTNSDSQFVHSDIKKVAFQGNCQICKDDRLLDKNSIAEVKDIQTKANEQDFEGLKGCEKT